MKCLMRACCLAVLTCILIGETHSFDRFKIGSIPKGSSAAMTHEDGPPQWEIIADSTASRVEDSIFKEEGRPVCGQKRIVGHTSTSSRSRGASRKA